ncbi:MAG: FAD-dependent oxidoreductase [archaeon]
MYDLIIIGSGPSGLTAAIYASRYKLNTIIIAKELGTLSDAHIVENYPGFTSITGLDIMNKFKEHVQYFKVPIIEEEVTEIKKEKNFKVHTDKKTYESKTIILAIGTKRRKLNLPNEEKYLKKGITYCYTCDAPFMHDKTVAVIGGSDSAVQASLLLSEYAKKIYLMYRSEKLTAEPILVEKIKKIKKIEIMPCTEIKELKGSNFLSSVILNNNKELKIEGLFVEIGAVPSVSLIKDLNVKTDNKGYIITNELKETNIKGLFAAGDITTVPMRQAIVAAADGAVAAFSAYKYCQK